LKGDFTEFPSMPKGEILGKLVVIDVNDGKNMQKNVQEERKSQEK
jgi:hypothetical protein